MFILDFYLSYRHLHSCYPYMSKNTSSDYKIYISDENIKFTINFVHRRFIRASTVVPFP